MISQDLMQSANAGFSSGDLAALVSIILAAVGVILTLIYSFKSGKQLKKSGTQIEKLTDATQEVKVATRYSLNEFTEIFDLALEMISEKNECLWIVSLFADFGRVHLADKDIRARIGGKGGKIDQYFEMLRGNIANVKDVRLILLDHSEKTLNNILGQFAHKYKAHELYKTLRITPRSFRINYESLISLAKGRSSDSFFCLTTMQDFPFQMLITESADKPGTETHKLRCLIFFVGTGTVYLPEIKGLYTENKELIKMMQGIFLNLPDNRWHTRYVLFNPLDVMIKFINKEIESVDVSGDMWGHFIKPEDSNWDEMVRETDELENHLKEKLNLIPTKDLDRRIENGEASLKLHYWRFIDGLVVMKLKCRGDTTTYSFKMKFEPHALYTLPEILDESELSVQPPKEEKERNRLEVICWKK